MYSFVRGAFSLVKNQDVAKHNQRGLAVQNSMTGALKEMGYTQGKAAFSIWADDNRKLLKEVAQKHGIEIEEQGYSRGHLSIAQYKEVQRIVEVQHSKALEATKKIHVEKGKLINKGKILLKEADFTKVREELATKQELIDVYQVLDYPKFRKTQEENVKLQNTVKVKNQEIEDVRKESKE